METPPKVIILTGQGVKSFEIAAKKTTANGRWTRIRPSRQLAIEIRNTPNVMPLEESFAGRLLTEKCSRCQMVDQDPEAGHAPWDEVELKRHDLLTKECKRFGNVFLKDELEMRLADARIQPRLASSYAAPRRQATSSAASVAEELQKGVMRVPLSEHGDYGKIQVEVESGEEEPEGSDRSESTSEPETSESEAPGDPSTSSVSSCTLLSHDIRSSDEYVSGISPPPPLEHLDDSEPTDEIDVPSPTTLEMTAVTQSGPKSKSEQKTEKSEALTKMVAVAEPQMITNEWRKEGNLAWKETEFVQDGAKVIRFDFKLRLDPTLKGQMVGKGE